MKEVWLRQPGGLGCSTSFPALGPTVVLDLRAWRMSGAAPLRISVCQSWDSGYTWSELAAFVQCASSRAGAWERSTFLVSRISSPLVRVSADASEGPGRVGFEMRVQFPKGGWSRWSVAMGRLRARLRGWWVWAQRAVLVRRAG